MHMPAGNEAVARRADFRRVKVIGLSLLCILAVCVVSLGLYRLGYHHGFGQGYSQGERDEFLSWTQESIAKTRSWDGTITGHRNMKGHVTYSVGKPSDKVNVIDERDVTWETKSPTSPPVPVMRASESVK